MGGDVLLEEVARKFCESNQLEYKRQVGEGAFKQTFLAVSSGRPVALKLSKPGMSSQRSDREMDAMRRCQHPNIARLIDVQTCEHAKISYTVIVEEYLAGGTLAEKGKLSAIEVFSIGTQLIDALTHIAGAGLVHRDLKPENIMFREDKSTPVIVDFGVVRDLVDTSLTPTWAPRGPGTPYFASPEQLNNDKHQIDWRSDQFSLGVVLAITLTGEHPYQRTGLLPFQVVERVASRQLPSETFKAVARENGMPLLHQMVQPWSIQRVRTPELLRNAWRDQTTGKVPQR
jgi:serine/threonine protein kinase